MALESLAGSFAVLALYWQWPPKEHASIPLLLSFLIVLLTAIRWGRIPSIAASASAYVSYIYFFTEPYHSFAVAQADGHLTGIALLVVSLVGSQLSLTAQRNAAEALASRIETERLYNFGRALLGPDSSDMMAGTIVEELVRTFDATASAFWFDAEGAIRRAGPDAQLIPIDELARSRSGGLVTYDPAEGLSLIPVMAAETRMGLIASLRASFTPLAQRSIATITSVAFERVRNREATLRLARDIQMGFLPRVAPVFPGAANVRLFRHIKPTYEVGGDFFTWSALDEKRLFVAVGDVADKGIPASLFMARTITALDISIAARPTITEAMADVNRTLCANNDSQMFVTVFAAILDTDTGVVEYCDGGHEPPFVIAADGTARMIEKTPGLALGFVSNFAYAKGEIQLQPGESLVLYTDGINEAMNHERELFGTRRMSDELSHAGSRSAEDAGKALIACVHRFVGDAPQSDDLTLVIAQYQGGGS